MKEAENNSKEALKKLSEIEWLEIFKTDLKLLPHQKKRALEELILKTRFFIKAYLDSDTNLLEELNQIEKIFSPQIFRCDRSPEAKLEQAWMIGKHNLSQFYEKLGRVVEISEKFPKVLKQKVEREMEFRQFIDITFIKNKFYYNIMEEFNNLYKMAAFWVLPLILRKIFENFLIDIFRAKYGTKEINLFYNPNQSRFQHFSKLLYNLKLKLPDLKYLSDQLNDNLINRLNGYREKGNSGAHSIELLVIKEEIDSNREEINHLIHLLNNILNKINKIELSKNSDSENMI